MRYLQRALDLAEVRGYLRYPEVVALHDRLPDWFRALGTDTGVRAFEGRRGLRIPAAVREFYGCPPLACFLEATLDGEVFLADLADLTGEEPPPVVNWATGPHLVFAFHNHSGMMFAARTGEAEDPLTFCGFDGDPDPMDEDEQPPEAFSAWVFGAVDRHDARLDYWQGVYEKCQADPAEAARLGGVDWIRSLPGMAPRLK